MGFDFLQLVDLPRWNRKILIGYWMIIGLSLILSSCYDLITFVSNNYEPIPIVTLNTLWMCLGLLVVEIAHYLMKKWNDYVIILGGAVISGGIIHSFPHVSAILMTLYLPILVSIFYSQIRRVIYSFFLSLACFYTLYALHLNKLHIYNLGDLVSVAGILLCGTVVALGIQSRGSELLNHLRTSMESERDLLVRNVIMDKLAKTDLLTELYNHMSFHEYLDKLIEQGEKYNLAFQLALLDIDHFKKVNDTYGHRAGDAVLKKVASTIKSMVSLNDFPARYGGEEFAIIFTDMDLEESLLNLENIRILIAEQHHEELNGEAVTISIGVHDYQKGCTKESLFKGADEALYAAKRNGRNQTIIYTQTEKAMIQ
jgi:diguanylate cyclase (GGDEF)-like protein